MTPQQQFQVCAEMDGWTEHWINDGYTSVKVWRRLLDEQTGKLPNYDSYDVLIPLVRKREKRTQLEVAIQLRILIQKLSKPRGTMDNLEWWMFAAIEATPSQLREALLRATGRWVE